MERLLFSSSSSSSSFSPTQYKIHYKPSFPSSRFRLSDSLIPSLPLPGSKRVNSLTCKQDNSSTLLRVLPSRSSLRPHSVSGSSAKPDSPITEQNVGGASLPPKVVTTGIIILVNVVVTFVIHPIFALPAFAKTGAPAVARVWAGLLGSAWAGFLAGCLHTLSGPDHLAALAPLSIGRSQMESAAVGALWGCGHDAGQVIFGLLFLLLKDKLHIEIFRTWGTRVVGFTLLTIGVMGIREASDVPAPCVAMENGECDVSVYDTLESPTVGKKKTGFTTFATGIIHGLQPDALMMVLPALALPSRVAGAAYLFTFLLGTVVAMGSYTAFIGSCSRALKERVPQITEKLTWVSALVAIALGIGIMVSEFFGFSLY